MTNIHTSVVPRALAIKAPLAEEPSLYLPFVNLDELGMLPSIRACYFVLHDDQILYIGRTQNLKKRWVSHHILRNYDLPKSIKIAWYEAEANWSLEKMERSLIEDYKPKINVPCKPEDTKRFTIDVPEPAHRAFKQICAGEGITMAEKINLYISDCISRNQSQS
ncbi:MAG: GIY-YIG nuclease family protein [Chroococcidiopsis sp.]